jgi:hypothetical protein
MQMFTPKDLHSGPVGDGRAYRLQGKGLPRCLSSRRGPTSGATNSKSSARAASRSSLRVGPSCCFNLLPSPKYGRAFASLRYALPRPTQPRLTPPRPTSKGPEHVARRDFKHTQSTDIPSGASSRSHPEDAFGLLKHACSLSGCGGTPSRVQHNHLPLYFQSSTCRKT